MEAERLGAGEILLTSMDGDGTKAGYDLELTKAVADAVDIPVIATIVSAKMDVARRIASGADILNVSGAAETPAIVRHIREQFPDVPIIATGGPTDETILETIHAGANAITYTPPSNGELFAQSMARYRRELDGEGE